MAIYNGGNKTCETVQDLYDYAKSLPTGNYVAYSHCRSCLDFLHLTSEQYQSAHRQLIDILKV